MKKILAAFAVMASLAISAFALEANIANNEKVENYEAVTKLANPKGQKVFVVGDSTLSAFNDPYFYPRYGYGTKLQDYLNSKKVEVINLAISGRSSKSFLVEPNYKTLKDNIKKGDFLIIGFGHNDEKAETARYTNPNGSKEEAGSFKNSLYENYIKLALEKKAIPVLCTPIVRRAPGKAYEGSVVHITADVEGFPGGDYPKAIRELGAETKTIVIDLTKITKERYETLANDAETAKFHAQLTHKPVSVDNTHLNTYGASVVAFDVVTELAKANKVFKKLVLPDAKVPDETILVKNPTYIIPKYSEFNPAEDASTNFITTAPWYGTVFGDCGGEEKISEPKYYGIEEKGGAVEMWAGSKDGSSSQGKIAAASDGIIFYFQKLDIKKDFTITATAKVLNVAKNNQVAFGLMARDDVYIDKYDKINSNYVAVGGYKFAAEPVQTSFKREDGAVQSVGNGLAIGKDTSVKLTMTKKGDVITVKCGSEPEASYKVPLNEVDANCIYVGLFAVRNVYVEFSDISLK